MDDSGWNKTKRGRVVYDRPIHFFTDNDRLRIAKKAAATASTSALIALVHDLENEMFKRIASTESGTNLLKVARDLLEQYISNILAYLNHPFSVDATIFGPNGENVGHLGI
jgi:hypothetical protein